MNKIEILMFFPQLLYELGELLAHFQKQNNEGFLSVGFLAHLHVAVAFRELLPYLKYRWPF